MPELAAPAIPGAEALVQWFGEWPSFSDAEVLELTLRREGSSWLRVHAWRLTSEIDAGGHFVLDRHAVVTISFEGVSNVELADFSIQNVIGGLTFEPTDSGHRVKLWPCYGIAGFIEAARVVLALEPGNPRERA